MHAMALAQALAAAGCQEGQLLAAKKVSCMFLHLLSYEISVLCPGALLKAVNPLSNISIAKPSIQQHF